MDGILQILTLMAFLLGGAALVKLGRAPRPVAVDRLIKLALWALLSAMGFRLGNDRSLSARIGEIGLLAASTAVLASLGTVAALLGFLGLKRREAPLASAEGGHSKPARHGAAQREAGVHGGSKPSESSVGASLAARCAHFKGPAILLLFVLAGFALGVFLPPVGFELSALTTWALNGLLFFIGMQFMQSGLSLKETFLKPETLAVPVLTALGSLAGSLVLMPLFELGAGKALALAGGFGWYSLSGVLISDLGDPLLGSAAFLANLFRETIALVSIPFLARTRFPELAIGIGGATAMDVTLPLIEQSAGPAYVPLSFASGALLSLSVPFLVPLFFGLG